MDDKKKIEMFDKCVSQKLQDTIDHLSDQQLENLCSNIKGMIDNREHIVQTQIKIMSHRHRK